MFFYALGAPSRFLGNIIFTSFCKQILWTSFSPFQSPHYHAVDNMCLLTTFHRFIYPCEVPQSAEFPRTATKRRHIVPRIASYLLLKIPSCVSACCAMSTYPIRAHIRQNLSSGTCCVTVRGFSLAVHTFKRRITNNILKLWEEQSTGIVFLKLTCKLVPQLFATKS